MEGLNRTGAAAERVGGVAGWLMAKFRRSERSQPSLALLERITLAPRHSLALVEVEGQKILVATSQEGGPAFYTLRELRGSNMNPEAGKARTHRGELRGRARVSW